MTFKSLTELRKWFKTRFGIEVCYTIISIAQDLGWKGIEAHGAGVNDSDFLEGALSFLRNQKTEMEIEELIKKQGLVE